MLLCSNRIDFLFRGLYLVLWDALDTCPDQIPAFFLILYFDLMNTLEKFIGAKIHMNIDDSDSIGRTVLYIASALGHVESVKSLLEHGADVSGRKPAKTSEISGSAWWLPPWARDDSASHAICVAAESGHIEVVQVLIDNGAEINAVGSFQDGALEGATFCGHTDVVELLLRHDARITRSTLQCSAYNGQIKMPDLFLQYLAPHSDPEKISKIAATQDLSKALYAAALAGCVPYAEKLLSYGVDPNESTITSYRTPLQAAASQGHVNMMKVLLMRGAEVDSTTTKCKDFYLLHKAQYYSKATPGTALQAVAFTGKIEAVVLLLQERADVNLESGYYGTALQAAAAGCHHDILQMLLRHEADVTLSCSFYGNALSAAGSTGLVALVQTLLNSGADIKTAGGVFRNALQAAAWNGNPAIVDLLLGSGADPNSSGGIFGNALQAAAVGCPIMDLDPQLVIPKASSLPLEFQSYAGRPLDKRVLSNMIASQVAGSMARKAAGSKKQNPMKGGANTFPGIERQVLVTNEGEARHEVLQCPHKSSQNLGSVKLLLDAGASVKKIGGKFNTALQAACYAGHLQIVDLLLTRGADIHISYDEEHYPWTRFDALRRAIDSGHTETVKHLLESGANARASSAKKQVSNLHRAATQNADIVRMLLDCWAEVDALDDGGNTPIMAAVMENKLEIVELLISRGADVNRYSTKWRNLLSHSTSRGFLDLSKSILRAEVTIESINTAFRSLLLENYFHFRNPKF